MESSLEQLSKFRELIGTAPSGVRQESIRSPSRVNQESLRSLSGVCQKSVRSPSGFRGSLKSLKCPLESIWGLSGRLSGAPSGAPLRCPSVVCWGAVCVCVGGGSFGVYVGGPNGFYLGSMGVSQKSVGI